LSELLDVCRFFFFSSRRRHTRSKRDWSSDVCSSDLVSMKLGRKPLARRLRAGRERTTSAALSNHARRQITGRSFTPSNVCCRSRSEEHTSELQSRFDVVGRLRLQKKTKR